MFDVDSGNGSLVEIPVWDIGNDVPASRELVTDRPGRGRRPTGPESGEARHQKGPATDPRRHEKERFARMIAEKLDKQRIKTRLEALLVVAPPKMLGDLRNAFSSEVRNRICEEISKDLAGLKREEIERQLVEVLRSRG